MNANEMSTTRNGPDVTTDATNILVVPDEMGAGLCSCLPDITVDTKFLLVSYTRPATTYVEYLRENAAGVPTEFVVVQTTHTEPNAIPEAIDVHVESPDDLAGLGLRTTEFLTKWNDTEEPVITYFDSITALLQYSELKTAYRFFHTFTGQVANAGARGYYTIVPAAHDESTVGTLTQLFDTEVR